MTLSNNSAELPNTLPSNETISQLPLEALAFGITDLHRQVRQKGREYLLLIKRTGDYLNTAKAKVKQIPSGRWLPWLREHCPEISNRTASNYMKIALAENWELIEEKLATDSNFSSERDALSLIKNKVRQLSTRQPTRNTQHIDYSASATESSPIFSEQSPRYLRNIEEELNEKVQNGFPPMTNEEKDETLNTLANIEGLAKWLRNQLANSILVGADGKCPKCNQELIAYMESCLCGWNTGRFDLDAKGRLQSDSQEFYW